jgi:hypothetical protein
VAIARHHQTKDDLMAANEHPLSKTLRPPRRRLVRLVAGWLGLAVVAWAAIAPPACGCDTPVYRYAMYRWMPAPYEVYYFHRGQPPKVDQEVNGLFADDAKSPAVANVTLTMVNLDQKDPLGTLPEPVQKAWQVRAKSASSISSIPAHLVWTPWGEEVFAGKLNAAEARAMLESPLRTEIIKLLDEGHGIVLLVVSGSDAKENARVESAVKEVIAKAAAGEISADPSMPPPAEPAQKPGDGGDAAVKPPALRLALAKLDRANPNERWLLRMLMAMEPGLEKRAGEPMLFAVYGRGRVMPPGIGKEVTAESLFALVSFLAGQCSCTIKDQNPGLDLLVKWDWEATAEKYAREDEAAVRSQPLYREVAADGPEMTQAPDPGTKEAAAGGPAASKKPSEAPKAATAEKPAAASQARPASQPPQAAPEPHAPPVGRIPNPSYAELPEDVQTRVLSVTAIESGSFVSRQAWGIGLGLAVVAAIVVGAGFVLIRKQTHGAP